MILCAGEALIDMLPRHTRDGESSFAPHTGGAVFNTAIALGRLQRETQFYSGISHDFFGDMLIDALTESNVKTQAITRLDAPTTLAFVRLNDGHATYSFYDENSAGRQVKAPQSLQAHASFFGGISLAVEPCAQVYEDLHTAMSCSGITMIDPNIRPSFIKDETVFRDRMSRMMSRSNIVKLSDEDALWLLGEGDPQSWSHQLIESGTDLVCITQGAQGVQAFTANMNCHVAASSVDVVDTVGAGDTFNAGLLASLDEQGLLTGSELSALTQEQLTTALNLGAQAAAITVSRAGANPPTPSEIASA